MNLAKRRQLLRQQRKQPMTRGYTRHITPGVPDEGVDYAEKVGASPNNLGEEFVGQLMTALSQFNQLNGGPKTLPPAVIAKRARAKEQLDELIERYREEGVKPRYRLLAEFFVDDVLIPASRVVGFGQLVPNMIDYDDIPNESMEPVNEPARKVHALFLEWIGGKMPDLADQSYEAYLNRNRRATVVGEVSQAPVFAQRERAKHAEIVDQSPEEMAAAAVPPTKVLGTIQEEMLARG